MMVNYNFHCSFIDIKIYSLILCTYQFFVIKSSVRVFAFYKHRLEIFFDSFSVRAAQYVVFIAVSSVPHLVLCLNIGLD